MLALLATLTLLQASPRPQPSACYEVFVRSFYDSNGDGIGDLNGLTQKLDYIKGLGADCIWLMPVAESPSYHGYDVTDYYKIEPDYGTNDDFKRFMSEAHRRGIKVIVDLVLNHASDQHPYFQASLRDTASPYRNWFIWSPTPGPKNQYGNDNWHRSPVRDEYYFGFFWKGMPDLNFRNPAVMEESKRVARFWLEEMGVDGFRLDAVRHLVEDGPIVSNTPGTHQALRDFGGYVRSIAPPPQSFTIGEVWDNIDVQLTYYPDQLDSYFAFDVADAIIDGARTGKGSRILPAVMRLEQAIPDHRWAPFLRNHDQTRTMTELKGNTAAAKVAATILLTLPGVPFVYYGEEIGMTGDKPDERLRTPMQWSASSAGGFSTAQAWESLQPDSLSTTVAAQDHDSTSLLNHYRRLMRVRAAHPALTQGSIIPLDAGNDQVVAYIRTDSAQAVLVVANLGATPLENVRLRSADSVLARGRYRRTNLLGGPGAAPLTVGVGGRLTSYVPLRSLRARQAYVFALVRLKATR
jgi:glycosidase